MKNYRKILTVLLVLICIMICACDVEWIGWGGDSTETEPGSEPETISTSVTATVDVIYATEMDVITDDDVVLTCDLPSDPVLIEGDRVEIIIDFESLDDNWVMIDVQFDQKVL